MTAASLRATEREQDNERTERAARTLRRAIRAAERELKDALEAGVDLVDAPALAAIARAVERAGGDAAYTLRHVTAREHGRQDRERAERAEEAAE